MTNNCYSCKYCKNKKVENWHDGTFRNVGLCEKYENEVFDTDGCSEYEGKEEGGNGK